ncbi:MAG: hypothetical protein JKY48_17595 [Flavobacteriales bacterium]|nr:hypothetical protein [Flavobacteriales bacterium]
MSFINEQVGVAVGYVTTPSTIGQIYRTENGGKTWIKANNLGVDDYNFISPEKHIVGNNGILLLSESGGTLKKVATPTIEDLIYLRANSSQNELTIYSESGKIWKSLDNGDTWGNVNNNLKNKTNGTISKYTFDDNNNALAVNNVGEIFYSSNEGVSWNKRNLIKTTNLTSIAVADGTFVLGGDFGSIQSYNNVAAIQGKESDLNGKILKLTATSANHYFAIYETAAAVQEFASSTDAGKTWTPYAFANINVADLMMQDNLNGYIALESGQDVLKSTTDGGVTWTAFTKQPDLTGTGSIKVSSVFKDANHAFVGRSDGKISFYIDGLAAAMTGHDLTTSTIGNGAITQLNINLAAGKGMLLSGQKIYFADGTTSGISPELYLQILIRQITLQIGNG